MDNRKTKKIKLIFYCLNTLKTLYIIEEPILGITTNKKYLSLFIKGNNINCWLWGMILDEIQKENKNPNNIKSLNVREIFNENNKYLLIGKISQNNIIQILRNNFNLVIYYLLHMNLKKLIILRLVMMANILQ